MAIVCSVVSVLSGLRVWTHLLSWDPVLAYSYGGLLILAGLGLLVLSWFPRRSWQRKQTKVDIERRRVAQISYALKDSATTNLSETEARGPLLRQLSRARSRRSLARFGSGLIVFLTPIAVIFSYGICLLFSGLPRRWPPPNMPRWVEEFWGLGVVVPSLGLSVFLLHALSLIPSLARMEEEASLNEIERILTVARTEPLDRLRADGGLSEVLAVPARGALTLDAGGALEAALDDPSPGEDLPSQSFGSGPE